MSHISESVIDPSARVLNTMALSDEAVGDARLMVKKLPSEQQIQLCSMELTPQEREMVAETLRETNSFRKIAWWYQTAAMVFKFFIVGIGVAVPVFISLQSTYPQYEDVFKILGIAFSALGTLLAAFSEYLRFDSRGEELNTIATNILKEFRLYRAHSGETFGPPEASEDEEPKPLVIPNLDHVPLSVLKAIIADKEAAANQTSRSVQTKKPWETHTDVAFKKYMGVVGNLLKKAYYKRDSIFRAATESPSSSAKGAAK